jgi:hypothetical protein
VANLMDNPFNVIVYNFVDMLSHARTEMEVIRELAEDEAAYRSITLSWFEHSPLLDILRNIAEGRPGGDHHGPWHGARHPAQQSGGRPQHQHQPALQARAQPHLRGQGRARREGPRPGLPAPEQREQHVYVFAKKDLYFVYPNNYNHFVNFYRNTFQHGGISLEEMIVPVAYLKPR